MQIFRVRRLSCAVVTVLMLGVAPAHAQMMPLEVTNIKPAGTGLSPTHRIYRAYPGLEYNIRAAVIGGVYPYTYSLTNAPTGMSINASTGEISWANPQANASPTLVVRDSVGAQITSTWAITVTTSGFVFVDGANGRNAANNGCTSSCGTGTTSSPWRTISDLYHNGGSATIAYFRNGTYGVLDLPRTSADGPWDRVQLNEYAMPVIWLAQPGTSPRIDFGYTMGGPVVPFIRFTGESVYVDGFETTRARIMAFQVVHENNRGSTFRRNNMHDLVLGGGGTNAAFIMTTTNAPAVAVGMVVQDNRFAYNADESTTVKFYSLDKLLLENNVHSNGRVGTEIKADIRRYTVRGETYHSFSYTALGGNMHDATGGEILFNKIYNVGLHALDLNQDGMAVRTDVRRNTFVGRVQVRNVDSADGPFNLSNNVIVNSDAGTPSGSHIYHYSVSAPSRIVVGTNLTGYPADNIVDAQGNLTPAYQQYIGTRGHQTGPSTTLPAPAAPTNVRIVR